MAEVENSSEIMLPPILDLGYSEHLWIAFGQIIDAGKDVVLDASSVERLSTGPVQVMLAAAKSIEENKLNLFIKAPSDAFLKSINDLGLGPVFAKWRDA